MRAARRRRPAIGSLVFTALLWLVALVVLVGGLGFRFPANLAPVLVGGAATALLSWLLIAETVRYWRGDEPNDATSPQSEASDAPGPVDDPAAAEAAAARAIAAATSPSTIGTILPDSDPESAVHERSALAWAFASVGLLLLLGFLVGVTIAMVGLLRVYGRESWRMTLLTTALVMVTLHVAFGVILRIAFFPGLIPELLGIA